MILPKAQKPNPSAVDMPDQLPLIKFYGTDWGQEPASIAIQAMQYHADGIDITVSIRMLNYNLHVETFFSGFYLYLFIGELEKIKAVETNTAVLNNYDESLKISFLRTNDGRMFVSLKFRSIFPQGIDHLTEKEATKDQSDPSSASVTVGSNVDVNFMGLQDSLEVIFDKMTEMIYKQVLDTRNPFDIGNAGHQGL